MHDVYRPSRAPSIRPRSPESTVPRRRSAGPQWSRVVSIAHLAYFGVHAVGRARPPSSPPAMAIAGNHSARSQEGAHDAEMGKKAQSARATRMIRLDTCLVWTHARDHESPHATVCRRRPVSTTSLLARFVQREGPRGLRMSARARAVTYEWAVMSGSLCETLTQRRNTARVFMGARARPGTSHRRMSALRYGSVVRAP